MKNSGAAPVLFGACLASSAVHQCSCFTASPRVSIVAARQPSGTSTTHNFLRRSNSARLSATKRPSSASSSPTAAAETAAAAAAAAGNGGEGHSSSSRRKSTFDATSFSIDAKRRRHQKTRRRTLLSSSGGDSSSSTVQETAAAAADRRQPLTTSQQLRAEVAARRSRAWGLVGFPPPPAGGFDGQGLGLPPSWGEDDSATAAAAGRLLSASAREGATDDDVSALGGELHQDRYGDDREQQEQQQRLLDMTQPPPKLLAAAETRSIDDRRAATPASSKQQLRHAEGMVEAEGGQQEEEGVSLWASRGMLAGAAMLYGTNFGCVKLLEESVPMSLAAALRFSVALVPFVPFLRKVNPGVFRAGAEVGLLNAIGYWAQSESLMTTTASKSAFICSLAVVFVPVLDALLGAKDTPQAAQEKAAAQAAKSKSKSGGGVFAAMNGPWFPALLAAAGVACLELIGAEGGANSGDVWALVQPLCFGLGFWLTERCSRKYPDEIFGLVAAQLLTVAVLAIGWCVQAGDLPLSLASLRETVLPSSGELAVPISLMWTGLVTTSLTVFGETLAMKKVSAAESTIILSTEPIWGTAFAAVLLGETIGWNTGLGALLIVSACTWTSVGPALQSKMLSLVAAAAGASTAAAEAGIVDVDDLADTVGTVLKEIVSE